MIVSVTKIIIKFIIFISFCNYNEDYLFDYSKFFLTNKKISIVIPVFNSEKYLSACLNSVINQTLKNIEIICIDDGSTDNSSIILQSFNDMDNRFIVINQINQGSGYSRNKGINISTGKYISFLDSDDMYYNNHALELLYDKARRYHATICGGGMEKIRIAFNQTIINYTFFKNEGFIKYSDYQYDYDYQRYIYNANFLKRNKLYFPKYLRYQDPPFFIKAMVKAKKFYAINNFTNIYRKNIDKEFNLKQVIDLFLGLKECLELAEKMKYFRLYKVVAERLNMKLFLKSAKKFDKDENLNKIIIKLIKSINMEKIKKHEINVAIDKYYTKFSG